MLSEMISGLILGGCFGALAGFAYGYVVGCRKSGNYAPFAKEKRE